MFNEEVRKLIQKEVDALEASIELKKAFLDVYETGGLKFEGKEVEAVAVKKMQLTKDVEFNTIYLTKIKKLLEPV